MCVVCVNVVYCLFGVECGGVSFAVGLTSLLGCRNFYLYYYYKYIICILVCRLL
eukprot:m.28295 g.28295  ORF g.28295 m.28295 type:complete len:54 (+) comp15894_c0_seq1:812-973(+)